MRIRLRWIKKAGSTLLGLSGATAVFLFSASTKVSDLFYTAALVSAGMQEPQAGMSILADSLTTTSTASTTISANVTTETTRTTQTTANKVPSSATVSTIRPPGEKGDGGKLIEKTMALGSEFVNLIAVRNKSRTEIDLKKEATAPFSFTLSKEKGAKVLIIHTHTTESYMLYDAGYYNNGDADRTEDESKNVCAVGEAVAKELRAAGIETVHDTTVHDSPQYRGAYTRSEETVKKVLKKHPTIQVVLDLHRDCIMNNEKDKIKPTAEINGKKAAQMMMVMGVTSTKTSPHPKWRENLHFAMALQRTIRTSYPNLMRPISLTNTRYNQHLSTAYVLVEMGSDGNTLEEAVYSGQLLGGCLATLMLGEET